MRKGQTLLLTTLLTGVLCACDGGGGMPSFNASPSSAALSAKVGASASQSITLTNTGSTDLTYTTSSDSAWLSASSGGSGSIPTGQSASVGLSATCTAAGTNTGHLTISAASLTQVIPVVLTCVAADTTPDSFLLLPVTGAALNSAITSNEITVAGIDAPTPISVAGGQLILNGAVSSATTVHAGDKVAVRVTSSASANTATNAVLTIGGVSSTFTVVTGAAPAPDTTPDPFIFNPLVNQTLNATVTSNEITISGINAPAPVSLSGGTLVVNGVVGTPATVNNGDKVKVQVTTAATNSTPVNAILSIGGVSAVFSATTQAAAVPPVVDTTPNPFIFNPVVNQAVNTVVTSNEVTISGINAPVPVTLSGGTLIVNGVAGTPATVNNGDKIKIQATTASTYSTSNTALLTVGGVSAVFSTVTQAAPPPPDTTPDPFIFNPLVNQALNTAVTSNAITVSGLSAPAPVSVSGGTLVVNGVAGAFATVNNGDTVAVKVTTAATYSTPVNALVTIGGVSGNFSATTQAAPPPAGTTVGPMQVSATALAFNGTSGSQTVNITKANYSGALTQTNTCGGMASIATNGATGPAVTMTVTPSAAGTCAITVTSGEGETATINVTVTTTSIIIN